MCMDQLKDYYTVHQYHVSYFHHTSQSTKEKLYKTLVRPHLDYATAAWDPFTSKNIKDLERVQNAAARFTTSTYMAGTRVLLRWKNPLDGCHCKRYDGTGVNPGGEGGVVSPPHFFGWGGWPVQTSPPPPLFEDKITSNLTLLYRNWPF